jgi:hypothetical protein
MKTVFVALTTFLLIASFAPAQQTMPMVQEQMKMMQHDRDMDHMAKTMTKAAEMCQMMMQQEMATAGLKAGALLFPGLLFTIALVLLIILEFQWIRYWSRRVKGAQ